MYLIERVAGGALYIIILIVICNGIIVSKKSSTKRWLIVYALILGVLGFIYIPPDTADLTRLIGDYHAWSRLSFDEMLARCSSSSTPAQILYFWIIGQTGLDGALPGVTALFYHLLIFSCIWDYARREDVSQTCTAITIAFVMSFGSFLQIISSIRSYLAFAIIVHCIYREIICSRALILSVPGYLIACLMHPAAIALTVTRFLALVFQKGGDVLKRAGIVAFVATGALLALYFGAPYLNSMFEKMTAYFSGEVYSYLWEYLIHGVLIVTIFGTLLAGKDYLPKKESERNLAVIASITAIIAIVFMPIEYSVFLRFSGFSACVSAPLVMKVLNRGSKRGEDNYRDWLLVAVSLMLLLACARGDLSGYKFMIL